MITTYLFKPDGTATKIESSAIAKAIKSSKNTVWVDVEQPTEEEYQLILKDTFNFHPLSIEDCMRPLELPKVDVFDEHVFLVFHNVSSDAEAGYFKKSEVDFFLGENYLVSVHMHKSKTIEYLMQKITAATNKPSKNGSKKPAQKTPDSLLYQILDNFIDRYFPLLDTWDDELEEMEIKIIKNENPNSVLNNLMIIKRELLGMRQSIVPQRDVLKKMSSPEFPFIRKKSTVYFKDVYDHIMLVYTEIEIQRDLLNSAFDAHTNVVNMQMNELSNKLNQVMQKLTIISTIFLPLTFVSGLYGMNFAWMPGANSPHGFIVMCIALSTLAACMMVYFKKNKWM